MDKATCPVCGKQFTAWRGKKFCCEEHRKRAENERLGYVKRDQFRGAKTSKRAKIPDSSFSAPQPIDIVDAKIEFRGYERRWEWIACNEVTFKLADHTLPKIFTDPHGMFSGIGDPAAVGWVMLIEGRGWFGRVRDERGDWSFGPSTAHRARLAVEAWLKHEVFEGKRDNERMWLGDCWNAVANSIAEPIPAQGSSVAEMINPTIEAIRRELADQGLQNLRDDEEITRVALRMRVARTAIREALGLIPPRCAPQPRPARADSGLKFRSSGLSDWAQCVDCGTRIRATCNPPRCNVCVNRAKAAQRALDALLRMAPARCHRPCACRTKIAAPLSRAGTTGRMSEAPSPDPRRPAGAHERVLEIEYA